MPQEEFPLVSVIVPTFNRPLLLKEALKSILSQTYPNLEIIVINDAGTPVQSIIESFNDPRIIQIEHSSQKGEAAARNSGITLAKGKYIAYLDDDDTLNPEHIVILLTILENSPFKVAYTDMEYTLKRVEDNRVITLNKTLGFSYDFNREKLLIECYIASSMCIMHEKACLDEVGLFDETLDTGTDWDLWIRLSRKFPFIHIPLVTTQYVSVETNGRIRKRWQGHILNAILIVHARYKNEIKDDIIFKHTNNDVTQEESMFKYAQEYRKERFALSLQELQQMNDEQIQELHPEKIMERIALNSQLHTHDDIRGARILSGYLVQRLPDNAALWRIQAMLCRILEDNQSALIAISRAVQYEESPENLQELKLILEQNGS